MQRDWLSWLRHRPPAVVPTDEGYALWAETYRPEPHNPLMEVEQSIVGPILADAHPSAALDVGTGTGRNLALLASMGIERSVGMDLSLPMLRHCDPRTTRICADAGQLPFGAMSFDLVCSSLMLGDLKDPAPWIAEVSRVLTPGGQLVYSDFHPSWVANKWKRTFRAADGRQFELAYFPHAIDDHLAALERHGFQIRAIREPRLAGRTSPVIVVFHAAKPGATLRHPRRIHDAVAPRAAGVPEHL
jgi:SAM-dependent methyltransferase